MLSIAQFDEKHPSLAMGVFISLSQSADDQFTAAYHLYRNNLELQVGGK